MEKQKKISTINQLKYSTVLCSILIITIILSISAKNKDKESFLSQLGYNGNIKSLTVKEYNVSGDTSTFVKGALVSSSKSVFNKYGNMIESIKYKIDNSIIERETFEYNISNNVTQHCIYSSNGILISKSIVDYDTKGIKTFYKQYNSNRRLIAHEKFIADEKGNIVESYNAFGSVYPRTISKYDSKNNLVEEKIISSVTNIKYIYHNYDKKGNVVYELKLKSNGSIESKFKSKYDKKGNKVLKIVFDGEDKIVEKIVFQYSKKKKIIKENYFYPDGSFKYSINTYYDKFEKPIKYKYTGYYDNQYDYKYIYDKKGNIISTIRFWAGNAEFMDEVELVYFD